MGNNCHSLFLSPHLDDAVLSCALKILKERQAGRDVAVATVCSKALPLPTPLDLYCGRRHEDKTSLAILGVDDPIYLNFSDAPFRNLYYTSFGRIILGRHSADEKHAKILAAQVNALVQQLQPQTVYLPLAVGTHIDHRHTHHLWCSLPPETKIVFYEDRPYSLLPYNLELRLIEIGAAVDIPDLARSMSEGRSDGLAAFGAGLRTVTMYKNVLTSEKQANDYRRSAPATIEKGHAQPALPLTSETISTNEADDLAKIRAAVGAYTSQISMLFKDMDTFSSESASYNNRLDAGALYSERFWTLVR